MANVEVYLHNMMDADHVFEVAADHVAVATGARWRRDGVGRFNDMPPAEYGPTKQIYTPDDIMAGRLPEGPVVIFDDDYYYMACVIAERLRDADLAVTVVTTETMVCACGKNTGEQARSHKRLLDLGVSIVTAHGLTGYDGSYAFLRCVYTGHESSIEAGGIVTITARVPDDALYHELVRRIDAGTDASPSSLSRIGDCEAPAIIAGAIFAGHRYARELDVSVDADNPLKYDRVFFEGG